MVREVEKSTIEKFSGDVMHKLNQDGSKLMPYVSMKVVNANHSYVDILGRGTVAKIVSPLQPTPINEVPHSRRKLTPERYQWTAFVDEAEVNRVLANFASEYVNIAAKDLGVHRDRLLIEAMNGNAISVDSSFTGSNIPLPASSIIQEDDAATNDTNLTLEKLIVTKRRLESKTGGEPGELAIAVNASAKMGLLYDEKNIIGSVEYNQVKALVNGDIDRFMGFNFVTLADTDGAGVPILPGTKDGTDADPVRCFAFIKRSVVLGVNEDIKVRMDIRADLSHALQIRGIVDEGATRLEEDGVMAIECVQAAN